MMSFEEFRTHAAYDLVGVPAMACYDAAPPSRHPRSIFPDAKSVIVLGSRIRRGQFRAIEEGSLWQTPGRWLTSFDGIVRWIESLGYECIPYAPMDAPRMPKRPIGNNPCAPNAVRLSVEHAAVAAGLGDIGYHGMFMTPQYGIRQALGLLITDLEIEPNEVHHASVCDGCLACAKACPLQALSSDESNTLVIGESRMTVGQINAAACNACPNGVSGDSRYFAGVDELHFEIENNQIKGDAASRFAGGSLPNRLSAACGRACIAHFESTHDTGYRIPFRSREPWGFRPDQPRGW